VRIVRLRSGCVEVLPGDVDGNVFPSEEPAFVAGVPSLRPESRRSTAPVARRLRAARRFAALIQRSSTLIGYLQAASATQTRADCWGS
jgi:hypothetical protein